MIIKHPLSTERSNAQIQHNKLTFVVDLKATKPQIKAEAEKLFNAKVSRVNTLITPQAQKRAIITFTPETPAIDIATKLGLM